MVYVVCGVDRLIIRLGLGGVYSVIHRVYNALYWPELVSTHYTATSFKRNREYDWFYVCDAALWCAVATFCLVMSVTTNSLSYMVVVGFAESKIGLIAHEACHLSCPGFLSYLYDFGLGSRLQWMHKHNKAHHRFTNTLQDPDIDVSPVLRIHPLHPRYWFHRYQWLYQYPLFCVIPILLRVDGMLFLHKNGSVKDLALHYVLAVPATYLYLIQPLQLYGLFGIKFFLLSNAVLGLIYGCLFSVSHVNELVTFDPVGSVHARQMSTTADWCAGSRFANYLTGGLNHQVIHHLYPHLPSYQLPSIADDLCRREQGSKKEESYLQLGDGLMGLPLALWSNAMYLKRMGNAS